MRELKKILFLCTGNSCRSQMAEGIAKKFTCFQAFSAGTKTVSYTHLRAHETS